MSELISEVARGKIINKVTTLEFLMDNYIAGYFSQDVKKRSELIYLVFSAGRITFENKRLVLKYLLEKDNWAFCMNHPTFHKDLGYLNDERNIFAHYPFTIGTKEGFIKLRHNFEIIEYSQEKIDSILALADKYIQIFRGELGMQATP